MNTRSAHSLLITCAVLFLFSCKDTPSKSHGPIILGDSSTIVTEKDPDKLRDLVTDLHPNIPSPTEIKDSLAAVKDTVKQTAHTDTVKKVIATPQAAQPETVTGGLSADFGDVTMLLGNVNAKLAGKADLRHANGAVYTLISGNINGSILKITGNVTKVSQRYQSMAVLKNGSVNMPIESLSNTTDWQPLKGGNNMYRISGLDATSMEYADDNQAQIHNAIIKAAQRHHMSKKKIQELESSIHNVRAANQKPLYVVLRSVMWKIDGKDAKGKPFSKQVRIDVPM